MHTLARNREDIWYANPLSWTYETNADGFKTGQKIATYGTPVHDRMSMAISSGANNLGSQGIADVEPYGIVTGYTHRAVTYDMNCPIAEESRIWFGILPTKEVQVQQTVNGQTTTVTQTVEVPHNFEVVRMAKSLNHIIYYLKEVDVQ